MKKLIYSIIIGVIVILVEPINGDVFQYSNISATTLALGGK